jgi:hypothetical protein
LVLMREEIRDGRMAKVSRARISEMAKKFIMVISFAFAPCRCSAA